MKIRDHDTGRIWEIDYIAVTNDGEMRNFFSEYDLLDDLGGKIATIFRSKLTKVVDDPKQTPPTCPHTETKIAELTQTVASIAKAMSALFESFARNSIRIETLESENQRLKDRLNAIEGLGIPR